MAQGQELRDFFPNYKLGFHLQETVGKSSTSFAFYVKISKFPEVKKFRQDYVTFMRIKKSTKKFR